MDNIFPSVSIPSFPYFCNMVVFPSPCNEDVSAFFIVKKTAAVPEHSCQKLLLEYLPGHIYCLLPSSELNHGTVSRYSSRPNFLQEYSYCLEIDKNAISFNRIPSVSDDLPPSASESMPKTSNFSRCSSCFVSHFPRPNTKLCKFSLKRTSTNPSIKKMWPSTSWWY